MKKTAQNDITGAWIVSKPNTEMFEKNFDLIFGKQVETKIIEQQEIQEGIADIEANKQKSRIDVIGQNGNDGTHYTYELNKSTGEVQKVEDGDTTITSK